MIVCDAELRWISEHKFPARSGVGVVWGVCGMQTISRLDTVPEACVCLLVFKASKGKTGDLYLIIFSLRKSGGGEL